MQALERLSDRDSDERRKLLAVLAIVVIDANLDETRACFGAQGPNLLVPGDIKCGQELDVGLVAFKTMKHAGTPGGNILPDRQNEMRCRKLMNDFTKKGAGRIVREGLEARLANERAQAWPICLSMPMQRLGQSGFPDEIMYGANSVIEEPLMDARRPRTGIA